MKINKKTLKGIIFNPGFVILSLIFVFGIVLQGYFLDDLGKIKEIILAYGILAPLIFIFLEILGVVFSPISGYLIWLPGFYIFGPEKVTIYSFLGILIGGAIAFLIARKFGRPIVAKLIGRTGMTKVDKLTKELGIKALWILRIFGGVFFDFVSYAAGLTTISFKNYLTITFFGTMPVSLIGYLLIRNTQDVIAITFRIGFISYLGMIIGLVLLVWFRKKKLKDFISFS